MADSRQCELFVLRYVPDVVKGEFVNIGVVLLEEGGERIHRRPFHSRLAARALRSIRRLMSSCSNRMRKSFGGCCSRGAGGHQLSRADVASRVAAGADGTVVFGRAGVGADDRRSRRSRRRRSLGCWRKCTWNRPRAGGVRRLADALFTAACARPLRTPVYGSSCGQDIAVAQYTRKGDPLKIDCGYRPNGTCSPVSRAVAGDGCELGQGAGVQLFGYAGRLHEAEHAMSDLTVITEDELDEDDEGVAFALATLRDSEINVARLAAMPQIAERARIELKL